MSDLLHAGVHGVDLVLVQLGRQGREVEEPVPAPADEEGGNHVPDDDVGHPAHGELCGRTEGRIDQPKLSYREKYK